MDEKLALELLRAYAPELRLSKYTPTKDDVRPERFWPMAVEPYVQQCSLWLEYRLFGLKREHIKVADEGEYNVGSLPSDPDAEQPDPEKRPSWWSWPFVVSRRHYLRYVQPKSKINEDATEKDPDDKPPKARPTSDQDSDDGSTKGLWGAVGCLIFLGALMLLLFNALFHPSPSTLFLLTAWWVLSMFSGTLIERARGLALAFNSFGTAAISYVVLHWLGWTHLAWAATILWAAYGLVQLVRYSLSLFKLPKKKPSTEYMPSWLGALMDLISSLDNQTADAAEERVNELGLCCGHAPPCYHYYGRVLQSGKSSQWRLVLQYWFFYPMNDWRTRYHGVDDHEGDWETVQVFLPKVRSEPAMVAYSQHLGKMVEPFYGRHPVVYVAAGSHANYPAPDNYTLTKMILGKFRGNPRAVTLAVNSALEPSIGFTGKLLNSFLKDLGQPFERRSGSLEHSRSNWQELRQRDFKNTFLENVRGVADWAKGDHDDWIIRPGNWGEPRLIDDDTPWVQFRGLWGRKVGIGESGPGGPKYDGNGQLRLAWDDPIKWAGLSP